MIWFVFAGSIIFWIYWRHQKTKKKNTCKIKVSIERASSNSEELKKIFEASKEEQAKKREVKKIAQQKFIDKLAATFVKPSNMSEAFSGMYTVLYEFSTNYRLAIPEFEALYTECQLENDKKIEVRIRQKITEAYKKRLEPKYLIESLMLCLLHIKFTTENISPAWRVSKSITILMSKLNYEKYYTRCIGFLYLFSDTIKLTCPDVAKLCEHEIKRMFSHWHADIEAKIGYQENLSRLLETTKPSDKHFILNSLILYLDKRRRFNPSVRDELVGLCKEDIRLYKPFLTSMYRKITFEETINSENYYCPYLPSFEVLWSIYSEEQNKEGILQLDCISKGIKR